MEAENLLFSPASICPGKESLGLFDRRVRVVRTHKGSARLVEENIFRSYSINSPTKAQTVEE